MPDPPLPPWLKLAEYSLAELHAQEFALSLLAREKARDVPRIGVVRELAGRSAHRGREIVRIFRASVETRLLETVREGA